METVKPTISPVPSFAYSQPASDAMGYSAGDFKTDGQARPFGGVSTPAAQTHPTGTTNVAPTPHWRDLWAAILFYVNFAVYVGVTAYLFYKSPITISSLKSQLFEIIKLFATGLMTTVVCAFGLALAALYIMKLWPEESIHGCYLALIAMFAIDAAYFALEKDTMPLAIACGVTALIFCILYYIMRSRLEFSGVVLKNVVECLDAYPSMLLASVIATLASVAMVFLFTVFCVAFFSNLEFILPRIEIWCGIFFFMIFSSFWTTGVISNTLQTTIAGVYATWYFLSGTGNMVKNPTLDSGRRALTYSFGSICIGSLIVATIQTLRAVFAMFRNKNSITGAIAECFLKIIEAYAKEFNYYVYTTIAIYGKPYLESARDTCTMLGSRGIDVIVGNNHVGACTFIMSIIICNLTAIAAKYALQSVSIGIILGEDINLSAKEVASIGAGVSIVFAILICMSVFEIVNAGATATFVCLADNPGALRHTRPAFFHALRKAHPDADLGN